MSINSNVVLIQQCKCGVEWEASLNFECCPECGFDKICPECQSEDTGNFDNGICRTCLIEEGGCADCYDCNDGYGNKLCVACSSPAPVPAIVFIIEDEDDAVCKCPFPKFIIKDGLQICTACNCIDHYKNGVVSDWSDDEVEDN